MLVCRYANHARRRPAGISLCAQKLSTFERNAHGRRPFVPRPQPCRPQLLERYEHTYDAALAKGTCDDEAYDQGKMAFRQAMPCPGDHAAMSDFIACVTYGMVLKLISNEDGTKLLYAANIAAGMLRREAKEAKSGPSSQHTAA